MRFGSPSLSLIVALTSVVDDAVVLIFGFALSLDLTFTAESMLRIVR